LWICKVRWCFLTDRITIYIPSPSSKIFPSQSTESFHSAIRKHLLAEMEGLQPSALLASKRLLRAGLNDKNDPDLVNLRESFEQAERLASGIPEERFRQIARREIKHKL
jgi:peroxisomal 3,2-trans-enoyl-CoA isomerase